jgi:DNA-binding NarL/FixJ family response regulator
VIRVAVADDHGVVRDGLAGLIESQDDMELAGTAANGAEAVELCRSTSLDVVLMDLEMPVLDGIEATRTILAEVPATAVLVLTSFSDRRRITGALDAGAVGYLLKDASADEVLRPGAARRSTRARPAPCSRRRARRTRSPTSRRASARCSRCSSTACRTS